MSLKLNANQLKTEIIAGSTTFLATAYIIIINPIILSQAGMPFGALVTATILVAAFSSILMGLYAHNPIVVAPGMGLNAFFTFTLVKTLNLSWQTALGVVFWTGVIFIILSLLNIREKIIDAIPKSLRYAISCGIGLFIAVIGLSNAKFIVSNPATIIGPGALTPELCIFVAGLFITAILLVKKIPGSFLLGIAVTTIMSITLGRFWGEKELVSYQGFLAWPDFSLIFSLDILGALKISLIPAIFTCLFTDLFDSLSTFVAVAQAGNLHDEKGNPRNIRKSLLVDAISTLISGLLGSSAGTSYIESATGIHQGGRTGLTALTAGVLFLPFLFFSPLLSMIPAIATAPILVCVGVLMMAPVTQIKWNEWEEAFPAFLAIITIPVSYSITHGIIWGFLSYTVIKIVKSGMKEITPTLLVIDVLAIIGLILK